MSSPGDSAAVRSAYVWLSCGALSRAKKVCVHGVEGLALADAATTHVTDTSTTSDLTTQAAGFPCVTLRESREELYVPRQKCCQGECAQR